MQNIAIYTRVSTNEQNTLNQRLQLEQYAQMQGCQVEVFEEIDRRKIHELLLKLKRGE